MSEIKLLPCPFCGGNKVGLWHNKSISPLILGTHNVQCYDCHFGLAPSKTKEEAIEKWNQRKPMQEIVERLEEESFWTASTYDEDGYCNDDSQEVVDLNRAIEIVMEVGGMNE